MGAIKLKRSTSASQPFYFTVVAGNGQTLVTSETYTSKQGAVNGMESLYNAMQGTVQYDDLT
ncbi:YegP family protein [Microbacterium sp. AR7-10]|uniref:YegP family protein n=1 Tax=Microbacterium sp. AR7-10 TaxID=1891970 RepID=UPI0008FC91F7|nr:YegP family protein [Microbacterium sp. AR7-10]OIU88646.1 hypothetical protein BFN01_04175 [Microbacterium sp. AR7-10]